MQNLRIRPYPGYERNVANNISFGDVPSITMAEMQAQIRGYQLAEGTTMKDIYIPGPAEGQQLMLHIITPAGLPEKAPIIMDIHGGGWVSGDVGIDNYRNVYVAEHTPAIVVAVEYTLASETVHFPVPLNDCICAYQWLADHAGEIGGDPENMGLIGTSAGGNLVAGMLLYFRDHGGPAVKLACLNCPALTLDDTPSRNAFGGIGSDNGAPYARSPECLYCGTADARQASIYAMPAYAQELKNVAPVFMVVGEYDPLRHEGLQFAMRLLEAHVPTEIICAPRVSHGFCTVDAPLTHWVHDGICASFRREFGMEITEF